MDEGEDKERRERRIRLAEARERAGFKNPRAASVFHNWPESTYRAHERGGRNFSLEDAIKYGLAFGVHGGWIWNKDESQSLPAKRVLPNVGLWRDVGRTGRRLNVLGRAAASPRGEIVMTDEPVDTVACPPALDDAPGAYAVYVVGNSMEPRYFAGEVVFVHPGKPYRKGDFVIVQVGSPEDSEIQGYIKQFVTLSPTTLTLKQLNPSREVEFPRNRVVSIHRIVMAGDA